jgi:hypothetical protein
MSGITVKREKAQRPKGCLLGRRLGSRDRFDLGQHVYGGLRVSTSVGATFDAGYTP